jgi:hypothetical protein
LGFLSGPSARNDLRIALNEIPNIARHVEVLCEVYEDGISEKCELEGSCDEQTRV